LGTGKDSAQKRELAAHEFGTLLTLILILCRPRLRVTDKAFSLPPSNMTGFEVSIVI
jgi:hypothetical protein